MFPSKFVTYPKLINVVSKTFSLSKSDLNCQSNAFSYWTQIQDANVFLNKSHVCGVICNVEKNRKYKNYENYCTKAIEVPPMPLKPLPIETDVFGDLGGLNYEKVELDEGELKEEDRLKDVGRVVPRKSKPSAGQYAHMIKDFVDKGDLKSAEAVIALCKENKDKPSPYLYTLLIKAFGDQGDIQTCWKYFAEMRSRRFPVKANSYVSLLNACAHSSSDSSKMLNYIGRIRNNMKEDGIVLNHSIYNVLVKAYGRHQKLDEAYQIINYMIDNKVKIGVSTLNSLMYAANSDKNSGLGHMIRIWQMMRKLCVPPNILTYNLLLRAIRETHFGEFDVKDLVIPDECFPAIITDDNRPDLLLYPPVFSSLPFQNILKDDFTEDDSPLLISSSEKPENAGEQVKDAVATFSQNNALLIPKEIAKIDLDKVLKQNKLILFGGVGGILEKMKNDNVAPDVKTITYLIELVPNSTKAEEELIKLAHAKKIPLDLDFYNMLIKKRALRGAKEDAKVVLDEIVRANLKPSIMTYGVLALSCTTTFECRELLKVLKGSRHTINKYIADAMLNTACPKRDFAFILELMEYMLKEKVRLDECTFEKLDEFQQKMTELMKNKHPCSKLEKFRIGFSKFNLRYKDWQEQMGRTVMIERVTKKKS